MRKQDVPQDEGVLDDEKVVSYALDTDGQYCLTTSAGWDPVNCANRLAWQDIKLQLDAVRQQIGRGEVSVLAYYMTRAQMDVALLASYSGISRWRVRRHLKPKVFRKLSSKDQSCYARLFRIRCEQLFQLPPQDALPMADDKAEETL